MLLGDPYVTDQLAMARLPRASYSLMLVLLPAFAAIMGAIVLHQLPTVRDVVGITLVVLGVALHQEILHQETFLGETAPETLRPSSNERT